MPKLLLSLLLTSLLIAQSVWAAVDMVEETQHTGNLYQDHSAGHQHDQEPVAELAEADHFHDNRGDSGDGNGDDLNSSQAEHDHSCFCTGHAKDVGLSAHFYFPRALHDLSANTPQLAPRQRLEALLRPPILAV